MRGDAHPPNLSISTPWGAFYIIANSAVIIFGKMELEFDIKRGVK